MSELVQTWANDCGCCAGLAAQTPAAVNNRPGLPAIAYRVGTHATFKQSMLARLSDTRWPALQQLATRDPDDFTVALLDAWAMAGDVLTFYQERIANESYLRTATERMSILEQSRLIGYRLAPGLAASTHLAFTMEEAPGAPQLAAKPLILPAGTRAQSLPGPDEEPQTFETIEEIEARVEWNAILPQLSEPQTLAWDMQQLWLTGANLTLAVGDVLLIIADTNGTKQAAIRRITSVTSVAAENRTGVALGTISIPSLTELSDSVAQTQAGVYVMRAAASPFGHNAPKQPVYSDGIFQNRYSEWSLEGEYPNLLTLSARNDKIFPDSWVVIGQFDLKDAGAERTTSEPLQLEDLTWTWIISKVINITHLAVARYGMAGSGTLLFLEKGWKRINESLVLLRTMTVAAQSEELAVAALPVTYPVYGSTVALNNRVDTLPVGRPVAFSGKHQHLRITNLAPNAEPVPLPPNLNFPLIGAIVEALQRPRLYFSLTEYVDLQPGDRLRLAAPPLQVVGFKLLPLSPADFGAALKENSLFWLSLVDRDGRAGAALLFSSWFGLDAAAADDETISEIAFIDDDPIRAITQDRDRTTLQLASPLTNVYDRANVRINANVAAASHGESVKEVLGSGAATLAYQSFTLRQSPLTYVSADTPSGSQSTLKVFVNDVLWQEAPFFYGRGAAEHIYVIRRDDEGRTTIQFGDGVNGARLPTGQNNVRAEYRKGSGSGGLVTAEQISQLLSRPLGLKEVINREAAQGAQDAESRDDARKNAPLTVLTLERAVSLQDYEDFSRTFAGIAKAQAVWLWDGRKRTLFITVAGPDGADLDEDGMVVTQLKEALRAYGDPYAFFTVKNFRKVLFQIQGTVTVDADHVLDSVMAAVKEALRERYSFNAREFGQPVALSEVIAAIQAVPGVVAVDLDMFFRNDAPAPPLQARLVAQSPAMGGDGVVLGAELLLLDEAALNQLDGAQ